MLSGAQAPGGRAARSRSISRLWQQLELKRGASTALARASARARFAQHDAVFVLCVFVDIISCIPLYPCHTLSPMRAYDDRTAQVLEEAERLKVQRRHDESIALLEGLLSGDPGNVAALEEVADNELGLRRFNRAVKAAKQAVALDKESYTGHYILGFVASVNREWEKAEEHLNIANEFYPNNSEILRCLGWVLFQQGKKVQGVVTLERSLNLDPYNTFSLCDLGVCYMESNDFRKAHALFDRALDIDPTNERAQECVEMVIRLRDVGTTQSL